MHILKDLENRKLVKFHEFIGPQAPGENSNSRKKVLLDWNTEISPVWIETCFDELIDQIYHLISKALNESLNQECTTRMNS